jgi:hypothetical protein
MTRLKASAIAIVLSLGVGLTGYARAQDSPPAAGTGAPVGATTGTVLTIHGKIVAVDEATKQVTLEANGKKVTFQVDNPYNLKNTKVGDPVVVRYYEIVSVRKKKKDEQVPSVSLSEGIVTAKAGNPGAAAQGEGDSAGHGFRGRPGQRHGYDPGPGWIDRESEAARSQCAQAPQSG